MANTNPAERDICTHISNLEYTEELHHSFDSLKKFVVSTSPGQLGPAWSLMAKKMLDEISANHQVDAKYSKAKEWLSESGNITHDGWFFLSASGKQFFCIEKMPATEQSNNTILNLQQPVLIIDVEGDDYFWENVNGTQQDTYKDKEAVLSAAVEERKKIRNNYESISNIFAKKVIPLSSLPVPSYESYKDIHGDCEPIDFYGSMAKWLYSYADILNNEDKIKRFISENQPHAEIANIIKHKIARGGHDFKVEILINNSNKTKNISSLPPRKRR